MNTKKGDIAEIQTVHLLSFLPIRANFGSANVALGNPLDQFENRFRPKLTLAIIGILVETLAQNHKVYLTKSSDFNVLIVTTKWMLQRKSMLKGSPEQKNTSTSILLVIALEMNSFE